MKIWKSSLIIIGIFVLFISTANVLAEEDSNGDIYHQIPTATGLSYEPYSGEKPYIDITDISYSINGSQATLTMTLADDIMSSAFVKYYMHLRTDEAPLYTATYSDGYGSYTGPSNPYGSIIENPVNGNMFTATFDVTDPNLDYIAWAYAGEFTDEANDQVEGWRDYAPDSFAPWYADGDGDDEGDGDGDGDDEGDGDGDGDDGTDDGGTPGFEILAVVTALGVVFILLRRKK